MAARKPANVGRAGHLAGVRVPPLGMRNEWRVGKVGQKLVVQSWGKDHGVIGGNYDSPIEIVVIPGFSGDMRTCEVLASLLLEQGYLVRSLNLPAHFGSPGKPSSVHDMSEYLLDALDKHSFHDKRLVLCTASAASAPSWRVAIELRDRLHSFVSVAGNDYRPRVPFERMVRGLPKQLILGREQQVNSPTTPADARRLLGYVANDVRMALQIGRVAWDADAVRDVKEFGRLDLPLVLIGAEHDVTSPPWMFLKTFDLAKPRVSVMIPDAGHLFCTLEGPMAQDIIGTLLERGMRNTVKLSGLDARTADAHTDWNSLQAAMDRITGRSTLDWVESNLEAPETHAELGVGLDLASSFGPPVTRASTSP